MAQEDYSAVWTFDPKDKQIKQFYPDLLAVCEDQERAIEMCEFLDFNEQGPDKV